MTNWLEERARYGSLQSFQYPSINSDLIMLILLYQNSNLLPFFTCLFKIPSQRTCALLERIVNIWRGMIEIVSKRSHQIKQNVWNQRRKQYSLHHHIFLCKSDRFSEKNSEFYVHSKKEYLLPKLSDLSATCIYAPTSKTINNSFKDLRVLSDVKVVHNI